MPRPTSSTTITAHKHTDRRANIPTEELRDFVADDEQSPVTLRYPRDPSLDPQLVWQGKDAQDGEDLAVPAVPIYIQEKIHPRAIVNDLLSQAAKPGSSLREEAAAYQLNLFADFNGGPEEFDQKVVVRGEDQYMIQRLLTADVKQRLVDPSLRALEVRIKPQEVRVTMQSIPSNEEGYDAFIDTVMAILQTIL